MELGLALFHMWMKPDIRRKDINNEGVKLGFNYGLVGDYNFTDNFAFSTGVMVNNFGGKLKFNDSISAFKANDSIYNFSKGVVIDYKLQYVKIPIALKGKTNEIGYMTYFLKAGINPMIRWKAKGDASQENIQNESIKEGVKALLKGTVLVVVSNTH